MKVSHTKSVFDFFGDDMSPIIPNLVSRTYRLYKTGDVFAEVVSRLVSMSSGMLSRLTTSRLIGIYSSHTGFAYGRIPFEYETRRDLDAYCPASKHLVLIYQLSQTNGPTISNPRKTNLSNNVRVIGNDKYTRLYLLVGLNSTDCTKFGLTNLQMHALRYLYCAIGALSRAAFKRPSDMENAVRSYSTSTVGLPLNRAIKQIAWASNRAVWKFCPNVLPSNIYDPEFGLFFFTHIKTTEGVPDSFFDAERGMLSVVISSLLDFVQACNAKSPPNVLTASDCLVPYLICGDKADYAKAYERAFSVFSKLESAQLAQVFGDPESVAYRLMVGASVLTELVIENEFISLSTSRQINKPSASASIKDQVDFRLAQFANVVEKQTSFKPKRVINPTHALKGRSCWATAVEAAIPHLDAHEDNRFVFIGTKSTVIHVVYVDSNGKILADLLPDGELDIESGTYRASINPHASTKQQAIVHKDITLKDFKQQYLEH